MDISKREELIAANNSIEEIRQIIGADSLGYLSVEGLRASPKTSKLDFCTACLNGDYPTELSERHKKRAFGEMSK